MLLPSAPVTGTAIEPSINVCVQRCMAYPGCTSE